MFTVIEIVLSLMVSLFIRFIQPWKQTVYLSLCRHKNNNIYRLIKCFFLKTT